MKKVSKVQNAAVSEAKQATKSASEIVNQVKKEGKKMTTQAVDNAYELGRKTRSALDNTMKVACSGTDYIEKQTKERPLASIGFAVVIGMLLAKLVFNKRCN